MGGLAGIFEGFGLALGWLVVCGVGGAAGCMGVCGVYVGLFFL